jgi:diaminopimelate epimerase
MGLVPPLSLPLPVGKAHAYGNDFLLVPERPVLEPEAAGTAETDTARTFLAAEARRAEAATVRELCHRHHGIGADGLILYSLRAGGATMKLWNADGSPSELSGNGLRCLAALVARSQRMAVGSSITIDTGAGVKTLDLLAREGERYTFRAAIGSPEDLRQVSIPLDGESVAASVLRLGNPQCVVIGPLPDSERFNRLGPALATHTMFPAGTNVEFAQVEAPDRVRILIWERGVGPTTSSGTGASASAVAAAAHGGAAREVDVIAPGGTQRVEWRQDGVYLTGWAELLLEGGWLKPL